MTNNSSEEPKDFFERIFRSKKKDKRSFEKSSETSERPLHDLIAMHFDRFKRFTEDLFNENKLDQDISHHDMNPAASDDEHLSNNLVMKRQYSREIALCKKMQSKKNLIKIKQK